MNHNLSPIYIKDSFIQGSLIDSGATCSLIKEGVARRSNCKIKPYVTSISGLSGSTTTVGSATEVIKTKELSIELDLFVVPDDSIPYDLIIGKNVLVGGGIQIVTTPDGITQLERVPDAKDDARQEADPLCFTIDGVDDETRDALADLLLKYKHMVASGNVERRVSTGEMAIRVKEDRVVSYHPYRLSISEREKVRKIITELLASEIIRESTSPYASPIIIVKKKNGEDRLCIDYRALNKITVKDRYPLPLIEDQLDRLGTGRYFTTLDMASGFYQIPIAEGSIDKTAFITPDGHYEFLRMPFGLANAPAVFQRAINTALGNLRNNIALVYLDDILIPSETIEQGFERLELVLKALDIAGFTLNLKKCAFFKTKLEYLGREISSEGVRPGMSKVNSLLQAPIPENVKQVRQFMGLASYFRKFIPEFAVRTACITKLTKKDAPWQWGADQEEGRKYILEKLSSKPLLVIFDPKRETELHTDASSLGYGAILFQRIEGSLRVVAYFSRRTTPEESRYHSYELETLAIVNALKCFRVYLLGINFKIVTDCNAIKATSSKRNLIPRIARWWVFLQDYTFEIEYRKGKQVEHVDYLSRNPRKDYRVDFVCEGSWLEIAQKNDEETTDIINKINSDHTVSSDFEYKQGILCRKIRRDTGRIVYRSFVPKGSRLGLLRLYHDENCHVGFDKTFDRISQKYWFPKMRAFVKKYLDHCITCLVSKRHSGPKQGFLHAIPKKCIPFDTIHCDCVGPFQIPKEGYQHILVIVDSFTKYLQLVPLKTLTGPETLQVFKERLTLFGTPRVIVLDRATNFTYKPLKQFVEKHGSEVHFIATGAPRANGQAERYVATVTNLLSVETKKGTEWPNKLAKLMLSLNTTIQKSTGFSPSRLLFGLEQGPGNAMRAEEELPSTNETVDIIRDRDVAANRLKENAASQETRYNKTRRDNIVFKEGDTVFIKPADDRRAKLDAKYIGPFTITEVLMNDRYVMIGQSGRPQTVPKDRLRLWKGDWDCGFNSSDEDADPSNEPC